MAELLTRQIVYEYQKRLKALPDYGNQDIRERRELRIELQNRCGITELQALNVLNGHHGKEYTWSYGQGVFQDYNAKQVVFPNKRARQKNDMSEAFQAALEEVKNSDTLDTIYFPAGTYLWSGLSIKNWDGNGKDGKLNRCV